MRDGFGASPCRLRVTPRRREGKGTRRASAQGRANGKAGTRSGQERPFRFDPSRSRSPAIRRGGPWSGREFRVRPERPELRAGKTETVVGSARDKRHPGRHGVVKVGGQTGGRTVVRQYQHIGPQVRAGLEHTAQGAGFCASPHKRARPCPRSVRRATNEPLLLEKRPRSGG